MLKHEDTHSWTEIWKVDISPIFHLDYKGIPVILHKTEWTPLRISHWFLLGIGISMSNLAAGLIVAGWLIVLGFRKKAIDFEARKFDLMQVGIAVLTIAAVSSLVFAISRGLLGHPGMNIIGNGSNSGLYWLEFQNILQFININGRMCFRSFIE